MTQLTGTVVEAHAGKGLTIVDLETGGNGDRRVERLVIVGEPHLETGMPIRATGLVRRDGAYCLDRGAGHIERIKRVAPVQVTAPVPKTPAPEPTVAASPTPASPTPASPAPASPARVLPRPAAPARALVPAVSSAPVVPSPIPWADKETRRRIFDRAVEVAREFKEHIRCAKQLLMIQGREYVTVAGWAILPSFENARCFPAGEPRVLDDGTVIVEAVVEQDGRNVSRGFGSATAKEKPRFNDRLAMAQTRARGSALKARYSVLLTLAGYEPSIAEEVEDARVPDARAPEVAVPRLTEPPAEATPTVVIPHPPKRVLAPDERPNEKQIAYALSKFGGSAAAFLSACADVGVEEVRPEEIPLPVLKRVVNDQINRLRRERTDAIGDAPAA